MPLDLRYVEFCVPGKDFYDAQDESGQPGFPLLSTLPPAAWEQQASKPWIHRRPKGSILPQQGWKVHVSAHPGNAGKVLDLVWEYCRAHELPFKFLRSMESLRKANAKYADRGSSGKFITIYPRGTGQLHRTLLELDQLLSGQGGPHILSDLRWRAGPLYVRYGAFTPRFCRDEKGEKVPALENERGQLVPDVRRPVFQLPPWVQMPQFLQEQVESNRASDIRFPYRPLHALHFSNGGGVYAAETLDSGTVVVLKEARPFAGLDSADQDAVTRLRHEAEVLNRLAGLPGVPESYGYFSAWDHHFLAMEKIDGLDLKRAAMKRTPLLRPEGAGYDVTAEYVSWALGVAERLERTLKRIHERGVVVGDLHPKNIVMRGDEPVFVDFEFSGLDDPAHVALHGSPGFRAPVGVTGRDADAWALAAVKLDLFLPHTMLVEYEPGKAVQLAEYAARRYGLDDDFVLSILAGMGWASPTSPTGHASAAPRVLPGADGERVLSRPTAALTRVATETTRQFLGGGACPTWDDVMHSMGQAVVASATPERPDRLFPGDIEQFLSGDGLCMAYGAAGVLHVLAATGQERRPRHEQWLLGRVMGAQPRPGLYNGFHGIAFALRTLGYDDHATTVLRQASRCDVESQGFDLFEGIAGAGLTLLDAAREEQDAELWDSVLAMESLLYDRLGDASAPDAPRGRPGLMHGWSGPALFWIRLHEASGRPEFLERAAAALRRDLRDCTLTRHGALEADEGWRTLPYLHIGGVGVGIVLTEYLRHAQAPDLMEADRAIERAACYEHYGMPTVSFGSTGILLYLCNRRAAQPSQRIQDRIDHILSTLRLHALPYLGHIAFRGNQSLRLSMDLATGTAGVLLAVHTALRGEPGLPFLPPERRGDKDLATPHLRDGHGREPGGNRLVDNPIEKRGK
ncbi:class III lanthionine synthetase LanKC [Streptomyces sp. SCA3-4]|uniref:class III lanthionine synthetase LanKC n=1 Tax=Streptomyces sichuanensis TaxID=2871810 RepID=UPI001CE2F9DE|nr:class III lanthionine synthetase LanKC [Streptomyces sichuanensis]MCA6091832.1 class III lanthionine synthetase LanKC [Streptomyces sichuanensis]